ncbi:hypothetical protein DXF93_16015 [Escherichia coli]|nr:hypothetical protein DXF93_16015 [Escherichia coli]
MSMLANSPLSAPPDLLTQHFFVSRGEQPTVLQNNGILLLFGSSQQGLFLSYILALCQRPGGALANVVDENNQTGRVFAVGVIFTLRMHERIELFETEGV